MGHGPLVLIDGAHNPEGAQAAALTLTEEFDVPGRRVLVVGMLAGRDPVQMLEALDVRRADLVIACTPNSPRAMPAAEVAAVSRALGVMTEQIDDVPTAVTRALAVSTEDDVVLVAGSLYVAGAARAHLLTLGPEPTPDPSWLRSFRFPEPSEPPFRADSRSWC